ncbi:hypothetical protein BGZ83_004891, partial [Gryganskiella cystojenkinii]
MDEDGLDSSSPSPPSQRSIQLDLLEKTRISNAVRIKANRIHFENRQQEAVKDRLRLLQRESNEKVRFFTKLLSVSPSPRAAITTDDIEQAQEIRRQVRFQMQSYGGSRKLARIRRKSSLRLKQAYQLICAEEDRILTRRTL